MSQATELNETADIHINGQSSEFPVVTGTYNERGILIGKLRSSTKYITLDVGFKNTGSTESTITFIDGEKGVLQHRGYAIEDLASQSSFIEVIHLLLKGELPTESELDQFRSDLFEHRGLPKGLKAVLDSLPDGTHPMGMLGVALNALSGFYTDSYDSWKDEETKWKTMYRLLANMPELVAAIYRRKEKLPYIESDPSLGYVQNFLHMMFGQVDKTVADALDRLLILHADHEQNCSASAVRFVGSSRVNLFAAVAAGSNALWGPLHGGANQAVLEMLQKIMDDNGDVETYIVRAKDKSDSFRLMGFGHRVYKNYDPRAKVIKKYVDQVLDALNLDDPIVDIAKGLEKEALADPYFVDRKLFPNVDFYSGIIYKALGIPVEMFTVMFALGRLPGWIAQWKEMRDNNEPIGRPRQIYTGPSSRDFVPLENR